MDALTLLIGFSGGAATLLGGAYIAHFLTHDRWWKEYRLKKIEEVHLALANNLNVNVDSLTNLVQLIHDYKGNPMKLEETRSASIATLRRRDELVQPFSIIPMLFNLYFQDFKTLWVNYLSLEVEITDDVQDFSSRARTHYDEEEAERFFTMFFEHSIPRLSSACEALLIELAKEAERIQSEKPWPLGWLSKVWYKFTEG